MAGVTAILLAYHRPEAIKHVLTRLRELPVDEVIVADNSSDGETAAAARQALPTVRIISTGSNLGITGRNEAAKAASNDLLLFLDDDAYPLPGAVEELQQMFAHQPRLGIVGGMVRDVKPDGTVVLTTEVGTFDWWLRHGHRGPIGEKGLETFFFPEGASMANRNAFLEVGGFYEPFFFASTEVDLTTRLLAAGWDVRYQPAAVFDHLKAPAGRASGADVLRYRIRNQFWYFWLRFPLYAAVPRMIGYGMFDLLNATYRGSTKSFFNGMADAWRQRALVRGDRAPIPRSLIKRVELGRGRMHWQVVKTRLVQKLRRQTGPVPTAQSSM